MTRRPPTPVEPGQVRRDPDPRHNHTPGRTITILIAEERYTYGKTSAGRATRILTTAIARWPIVEPPTEPTP
jgi:hypothetical protein